MNRVEYIRVPSVAEGLSAIKRFPNAALLAGGTTIADLMKEGVATPDVLVDINRVGLDRVELTADEFVVGAMVRNSDLAWHEACGRFPVLRQALLSGASAQIRNMATVGGNLLQRTRCPYFRDVASACNKRSPGAGCAALEGYHRTHAVLGVSEHCIATHPSDMAVALTALGACVRIAGQAGERLVSLEDFYLEPGATPERETRLGRDEIITAVSIPLRQGWTHSAYLKVRDRESFEFALASVALALQIESNKISKASIALGGVATKPWLARSAAAILEGFAPARARFEQAAEAALASARPRVHNRFKVDLAKRVVVRALSDLMEVA